ncbi:DUF4097 family beta strand repeat-containing protein [Streptococcus pacificus]|uniref:DUF4097 family beta strand repeat protein n=1 Tax=Streptococcus pacificus TaxID=2740577 RepID=A0ABS0ZJN4_9STRE|nr:DUF4097 family beta strand repeat-containing protein [Streptococcus pacificus]MBJ8326199.1 DUF4097 family beta strand repeat protein [Streptococcus pacificus]
MSRKGLLLFRLIAQMLLFLVLLGVFLGLMGHSRELPFFRNQPSFSSMYDTNREKFFEEIESSHTRDRTFSGVQKVDISLEDADLVIVEGQGKEVVVREYSNFPHTSKKEEMTFFQKEGTLYIQQQKEKKLFFISKEEHGVVVEVPKELILDYNLSVVSSNIQHDVRSRSLEMEVVSGDATIYQGGERLYMQTVSGDMHVYQDFDRIEGESVSGNFALVAGTNNKDISVETKSADVKIQLGKEVDYVVDYATVSGEAKDTYTGKTYSKSGKITKGEPTLKIECSTISGDLKLENWIEE